MFLSDYFLAIVLCFKMDLGIVKYHKIHLKTKILFSNLENDIMNFKSTFWIWIIQNDANIWNQEKYLYFSSDFARVLIFVA